MSQNKLENGIQRLISAFEKKASASSASTEMKIAFLTDKMREINEKLASDVKKEAKLTKKVDGVGTKAENDDMKRLVFRFNDKKTGKTKCAAFVEIADTAERRRVGLSKRASMDEMGGMFFDCKGPFWMKDVNFPLDLCYLDEKGAITEKIAMAEDKEGTTLYPRTKEASVHAIELPAGFCDKHGLKIGDYITVEGKVR